MAEFFETAETQEYFAIPALKVTVFPELSVSI